MWTYSQSTGEIRYGHIVVGAGYSGAGAGQNNPRLESLHQVGCIPRGQYRIQPPFIDPHRGPLCLPLKPAKENDMHGRAGFMIHGDSVSNPGHASEGSIVLPLEARKTVAMASDKDLEVVY
jgi:Protein of unknown function (DUF2778)